MTQYGKIQFSNGIYTGLIENGAANIAGIFEYSDGRRYIGQFIDNKITGYGLLTMPNGTMYLGNFNNGLKNGRFIVLNRNAVYENINSYFVGDYSNDKRSGQGYEVVNGEVLSSNYKNDVPYGMATKYSQYTGLYYYKYEGNSLTQVSKEPGYEFYWDAGDTINAYGPNNGKINTAKAIKLSFDHHYVGSFSPRNGKFDWENFICTGYKLYTKDSWFNTFTEGTFGVDDYKKTAYGNVYKVEREKIYFGGYNGNPEGTGVLCPTDGSCIYIGKFSNGKLNGNGIYVGKGGTIQVGTFRSGSLNGEVCISAYIADRTLYQGSFNGGVFTGRNTSPIDLTLKTIFEIELSNKENVYNSNSNNASNYIELNDNNLSENKKRPKLTGFTEADYNMPAEEYRKLDPETQLAMTRAYIEEWKKKSAERDKQYALQEAEKEKSKPDYYLKQKGYVLNDEYKKLVNLFYMTEIDRLNALRDEKVSEFIIPEGIKTTRAEIWKGSNVVTKVKFPNSFEELGDENFYYSSIKEVDFNDSKIIKIPRATFFGCNKLININLSLSIKILEKYAFYSSTSLTNINLKNVREIYECCFYGCSSLKSIDLSNINNLTNSIEAFSRCTSLKNINLSEQTTLLPKGIFNGCASLEEIDLKNVTKLDEECFANCTSLKRIDLSKIDDLSINAFKGCTSLKEIILSDKVTHLPTGIFSGCTSLEIIDLKNVRKIDKKAFGNCSNLRKKIIDPHCLIDDDAFSDCYMLEIGDRYIDGNKIKINGAFETKNNNHDLVKIRDSAIVSEYELYEGLQYIYSDCLRGTKNIISITTPSTLTNIGDSVFYNSYVMRVDFSKSNISVIPKMTFYNCLILEEFIFNYPIKVIEELAFTKCKSLEKIDLSTVENIGQGAFRNCTNLKNVNLSSLKEFIDKDTFANCSSLESVELSENITSIKKDAFKGCTSLKRIDLKNVIYLAPGAFADCVNLEEVKAPCMNGYSLNEKAFENCPKVKIDFTPKKQVIETPKYVPSELIIEGFNLEKVTRVDSNGLVEIPDTIKTISPQAFSDVKETLRKIVIGRNVKNINGLTFIEFNKLEEVVFNNNKILCIPEKCFRGCESLKKITIPESVKSIGLQAFFRCVSLENVEFDGELISEISDNCFCSCRSLVKVTLPKSVTKINGYSFAYCYKLKEFNAVNVNEIDEGAFTDCMDLEVLNVGCKCKYVKDNFKGNKSLKKYLKTWCKKVRKL